MRLYGYVFSAQHPSEKGYWNAYIPDSIARSCAPHIAMHRTWSVHTWTCLLMVAVFSTQCACFKQRL